MVVKNDELLKKVLASMQENIFKDVRYFMTGTSSDIITQILFKGGAKQEVHITDFLTHLIVGNDADANEVGEVRDIYQKPVVNIKWAVLSAKCGKMLPTKAFDHDEGQLFSGVKASISKVPFQDAKSLWGLISFYGGQCILHFDNTCTHLIVGEPKGVKLQRAYDRKVLIVTPDWVSESVEACERKDEFFYHPRLLNLSPSATPLPPSLYSKECHELKKLQAEKVAEAEAASFSATIAETLAVRQQAEAREVKGIFDSLVFSDDDDENSNQDNKSLLDQLKSAQTWKSSSSSSSPVQLAAKMMEKSDIFSNKSPKQLFDSVGESFGIDSSLLSSLLDDNSSSKEQTATNDPTGNTNISAMSIASNSSVLSGATTAMTSNQMTKSFNDSYVAYAEKQLSQSPQVLAKTTAMPGVAVATDQAAQPRPTPIPVVSSSSHIQVTMSSLTAAQSVPLTMFQNNQPMRTAQLQSSGPHNIATSSQIQLVNESPIQSYHPPQLPAVATVPGMTNSGTVSTSMMHEPKQTIVQGFEPTGKMNLSMNEVSSVKPVIGGVSPQMSYNTKTVLSNLTPGTPVHQPPMQSEVFRIPVGITPQQLGMMGMEERQRFLQQLHQKQLLEQQQRSQQLGTNLQIRTGTPYSQIRTPQGQLVPHQSLQGWSNGISPHRIQANVPQYAQPEVKSQTGTTLGQPQSWEPQTASSQVTSNLPVSVQATNFQIPQAASEGHPPRSPLPPQSPLPSPSYVRGPQPAQVMLGQQQTSHAVRHVQAPATINQDQQLRQAASQQQYVVSQGTATRIVSQPGWQQQPQSVQTSSTGQSQTSTFFPQQLQVQHLRQQFPFLGLEEAQQLLRGIPAHLREIQARDGHGRAEYLNKLEPRERQVVTAVAEFYSRRHQQQQLLLRQQQQQQQQQIKIGAPTSPSTFQGQFNTIPHNRVVTNRQLPPGYTNQVTQVVSPSQGSPRLVQTNQVGPQQLTQQPSPLASPHTHSPVQREPGIAHTVLQGSNVPQNMANQTNLVNAKTKTALANLLTNRLSSTVHQAGTITQGPIEIPAHVVQKASLTPETVQGPSGEHLLVYQRRTLTNLTNNVANNVVRPSVTGGHSTGAMVTGYPRAASVTHGAGGFPVIGSTPPHYPRLHLYGHDINILPRDICMVGCVFYIADYHRDLYSQTIECIKRVIQQHGGEVVSIYDTAKVTHVLCKHQKSPVFKQAVRENKRCITIYWLNDILIRGKMAPPWQAYHLPVPFGDDDKPMRDLIVSLTGFENDERTTIKLMLNLAGAKFTGYFTKQNHLLICKRFEGPKVNKARELKKPTLNAVWLSEMLLGQNVPPLSFYGSRYQHFIDDPLRIDPSLTSYLFNAWKHPISVSKESVEKANAIREKALRKRKPDSEGNQENKRCKIEQQRTEDNGQKGGKVKEEPRGPIEPTREREPPRIMLSNLKNRDDLEKKILELGGYIARTKGDVSHLVVGTSEISAPRTVKVMCAISSAKFILSTDWLNDSYTLGNFACESNYCLEMTPFEKMYDFSLTEILLKPNRNRLFNGKTFYLTPSVVPGKVWFREIIECAGGSVDNKRKSISEIRDRNRDGELQYLCITCEADSHLVMDLLKEKLPVYYGEFVLSSILRQRINSTEYLFQEEQTK